MSDMPQTSSDHAGFIPPRSSTVVMGRQDFISVALRSISAELYKLRRRRIPQKILLTIIPVMFLTLVFWSAIGNTQANRENLCPMYWGEQVHCRPPSQDEIQQQKAAALPDSLVASVGFINFVGMISVIILTGSIVGSEYQDGTIRMMLTRGPTRTQFLLAKIGTIIICILTMLLVLIPFGLIVGPPLTVTTGVTPNFSCLTTPIWLWHALLYVLTAAFGIFLYAMLALCLATLGRTAIAGGIGALLAWFLEVILARILPSIAQHNQGPVGDFLQAIPNYFMGHNISILLDHQGFFFAGLTEANEGVSSTTDVHAAMVLVAYLVVFIGVAWWAQQRDVTN